MMAKIFYNEYMLDSDILQEIDSLIEKGLEHTSLENQQYSDVLIGNADLIRQAEDIINSSL
jgi:hypothetical protein